MPINSFSDPVYDSIKSRLQTQWTATPIQFPNQNFEPDGAQEWVKIELHGTRFGQVSVGAPTQAENRWDDAGLLWLYLIVPRGTVDYTNIRGAAKALANIFRGALLLNGLLEFGDAKIDPGAWNEEDGASFVVPISIEWRHYDA